MPAQAGEGAGPAKRLRQLESVSGRGLLLGGGSKGDAPVAHYVTLSARRPTLDDTDQLWHVVYRSEAVGGTLNPEWRPLAWHQAVQPDPLLDSGEVQVLLALHDVAPRQHALAGAGPSPGADGRIECQPDAAALDCASSAPEGLDHPVAYAASSRPAFHLPPRWQDADAAVAQHAGKPSVAAQQLAADAADDPQQNGHARLADSTQQQQQPYGQPPGQREQQGQAVVPAGEGRLADGSTATQVQSGAVLSDSVVALNRNADGSLPTATGGAAPPAAADAWPEAAAAALASTGCCPGQLVAVSQVDSVDRLFAVTDLAALRLPLQPNTLVLDFGDGSCLCPPPIQRLQAPPPSLQVSPLKKAAEVPGSMEERADGMAAAAAAPAGATRRFANLLVSKLLRSTPNLQDASSPNSELLLDGAVSDADSDAGSDTTVASQQALPAAPSEPPPGQAAQRPLAAVAGVAKPLTLAGVQQYVTSLAALQARLRDLAGRSQALQQQLRLRLGLEHERHLQQHALAGLGGEAARCRRQAADLHEHLADMQAATVARKKQATVCAQALVTTLKVMQAASRRVGEAEASLQGQEGRGALVAVLRELVARRCQMVCELGSIFQLGPTTVNVPEAPPGGYLEDRLEQQWAGAAPAGGDLAGSMPAWSGSVVGSGIVDAPSLYRQEMRLSIGGMEVKPAVWRRAFEESSGYSSDAADDDAAGVALGYVAQMVDRLAAYLDVPLRYPLVLCGSRSLVQDSYPPVGSWAGEAEEGAARRSLFGRSEALSAGAAPQLTSEYPLYCESNRERPKFAAGVFLLNKNVIQLLQVHGISAAGPNQLLQNLYKLLLAAQSALPQPPPPPPPADMRRRRL